MKIATGDSLDTGGMAFALSLPMAFSRGSSLGLWAEIKYNVREDKKINDLSVSTKMK